MRNPMTDRAGAARRPNARAGEALAEAIRARRGSATNDRPTPRRRTRDGLPPLAERIARALAELCRDRRRASE